MKETNEWISDESIVWRDPTIYPEELKIKRLAPMLRKFCVETILYLPKTVSDPFLEFLEFLEMDHWTFKDVRSFRLNVLRIVHILEPIQYGHPEQNLDMHKWYLIESFSETWNAKVDDVSDLWREEHRHLLN